MSYRRTNSPRGTTWRSLSLAILALSIPLLGACNGSSGGGGGSKGETAGTDTQAMLSDITFPDPLDVNLQGYRVPPQDAPLNQQIIFWFTGYPDPMQVNAQRILIQDALGANVPGTFEVKGKRIVWTGVLPTEEVSKINAAQFDTGGASLVPGATYTVRIGSDSWPEFITQVAARLQVAFPDPTGGKDAVFQFGVTNTFARLLQGMERRGPRLTDQYPSPGASNVSPNLYTDPDGLFPPRQTFTLTFDGPVHTSLLNIGQIQLVDLDDTSMGPGGLPLGVIPTVKVNRPDYSVVEVVPSGILPFGHLLSLEYPDDIRTLSQSPKAGSDYLVASTFTVSADPGGAVADILLEDFDSNAREEQDTLQLRVGELPADWDESNSDVLTAAFKFAGTGVLGRFQPQKPPPGLTNTIILDTSIQTFPLMDGSTPDAPPGYTVTGGVFPFSSINIPDGVIIKTNGPNPLVLTSLGDVTIDGRISLFASAGTDDNAYDSSITSVPGGPGAGGGGRGGEGHPIIYNDVPSNLTLVSPPQGGRGWGPSNVQRIGGIGGQSGMLDNKDGGGKYGTNKEIDCSELTSAHNNGFRGAGAGGGSYLKPGGRAQNSGWGNVLVDGLGGYIIRTRKDSGAKYRQLRQGAGGQLVFFDSDENNDFIGIQGEIQKVIGGQGGGGGGSATDSYYCGIWCKRDADGTNDNVCSPEFGNPPILADSVGDSRGGSGGGGGGAFLLQALGRITLGGRIDCRGGNGGGGEALGCGNWGGCGAGGSGGAVVLQSAVDVTLTSSAVIDVKGGNGRLASSSYGYITNCGSRLASNQGTGGNGSNGIIQLQVPQGSKANVDGSAVLSPRSSWVDKQNKANPAPFSDSSVAQSQWYDLGRMIDRGAPGTTPVFSFLGTDAGGLVMTDAAGNVINPNAIDIRCDYLGQLDPLNPGTYLPGESPKANFIPLNTSVTVQFQGANAVAPGSKDVDPATVTAWNNSASIADDMQFIRWRISFDTSVDDSAIGPATPRPSVQWIGAQATY